MTNFTPLSAAIGGALIGLAAALLMLSTCRIAGISGIFGGLIGGNVPDRDWRIAFIAVIAMALGMAAHDAWQRWRAAAARQAVGVGTDG